MVIIISDLETSPGKRWFLAMFSPYECYENPTQGGRRKEREIGAGRTRDDFHRFWYRQIWRTSTVFLFSLSATLNYSHPWVMLAIDVWAIPILQTNVIGTTDWHWNIAMLQHVLSLAWFVILRLLAFIFITCVIGFSEILASMMRRETGSKTLRSERVLSRGDPNFNGTAMVLVMTPGMNPPKRQQDYLAESLLPRFIILELNNNG